VLRIVESWDGWLAAVWEGRGGMGKKKEKQRKRVSAEGVYIMVFTNGIIDRYILSMTMPCHCTTISV